MVATIKQVAERAGVSISAVSRSYTDGASVSAKMRKKVEAAAKALHYTPNLIARSLMTNRTKLIGLIANNFQNPVFLEVFDLYTQALQDRGLRPLLVNLSHVTDPSESIRLLRQYSVDGVIIATSTLPPAFALSFKNADIPIVHTFGRYSKRPRLNVVGIDNVASGKLAAETLLGHGYRSMAFLGGPQFATSTQDRASGFSSCIEKAGARLARVCFAHAYAYDAGRTAMASLLEEPAIEAVFCGDDLICMGAMDAARDAGRKIPEDIGFLGFNDMSIASWSSYNLTTIHQPIKDIILKSVELIVSLANKPHQKPVSALYPCEVIERKTLRYTL